MKVPPNDSVEPFDSLCFSVRSTPLLLAASSGGLSAVKCLIKLGADISRLDGEGNGMVNLAAMRFHTNVLEYLIEWGHQKAPVWKILVSKYFNVILSVARVRGEKILC